jgi:NADH:ubiquinone oxidoreductase subunit 5 (subunit L)/multisubunit Na+/H+ antiporter MnhA subunit
MIILAAMIKSAQVPFTSWLPRAMEGPTTSSAIFYGSLSVHIGVFVLLRTWPFWQDMLWAKIAIISIGALTGIIATLIARVQPTVKTQIAYSSAAQIGLMFIEVALGWHVLALIHFAGNAFLRTYQLLVSPSVLNYLVHHQYFHYHPPQHKVVGKLKAALYILAVKEWNLDTMMFNYLWSPFKWIGKQMQIFESRFGKILLILIALLAIDAAFITPGIWANVAGLLPALFLAIALLILLASFASRSSARECWDNLIIPHILIISAITINAGHIYWTEVIFYMSGVLVAYTIGIFCLQKTYSIDKDISLNKFHGYVYEDKVTAVLFLIASIALLGFPVTTAFIGIDVFFTYVESGQPALIALLALCFIFIELAAIRIFLRIYMGPHKKLYHPVAFRSS